METLLLEINYNVYILWRYWRYRFNFDGLLVVHMDNRVVLVSKPKIGDDFTIWVSFRYVGEFDVNSCAAFLVSFCLK